MTMSRTDSSKSRARIREVTIQDAAAFSMPYLGAAGCVGLVGAASVSAFVLILDLVSGNAFGTPNALGAALFLGEPFAIDAAIRPGVVFGYTIFHAAAFVSVAAAAVSARYTLTRHGVSSSTQLVLGIAGLFVGLQSLFTVLTTLLDTSLLGELGVERIMVANAIAAFSMAVAVYAWGGGSDRA